MTHALSINDRIYVPGFKEHATVVGTRYYTSRNNGITSMVADYVTDSGKTSFDGIERVMSWKDDANARLIAAAPEMLEALKIMVQYHEDQPSEASVRARAAIAKAEGTGEADKSRREFIASQGSW